MATQHVEFEVATGHKDIEPLLLNIEQKFEQESDGVLHEGRNRLKVIDYAGKKLVVKAFKVPNFINQFVYRWFRDSKAKRSYQFSLQLRSIGVSTPKPVGFIEFYQGVRLQKSYYISEYYEHDYEIREAVENPDLENRAILLAKAAEFAYRMHSLGALHLDFSPGNILVKQEEDDYRLAICDVNRMKFEAVSFQQGLENLVRIIRDDRAAEILASTYADLDGRDKGTAITKLKAIRAHYISKRQKLRKFKAIFKSK